MLYSNDTHCYCHQNCYYSKVLAKKIRRSAVFAIIAANSLQKLSIWQLSDRARTVHAATLLLVTIVVLPDFFASNSVSVCKSVLFYCHK